METLHRIENELMSLDKYQLGESEYITVITYSSDINSGAVALFKAYFSSGPDRVVTRLDLQALHITLHDDDNDSCLFDEALVATVPQMLAYLHLRYRLIDYVPLTPIFSFEPPLSSRSTKDEGLASIRRGIKLLRPPKGVSHVGNAVTTAVLFSRESHWGSGTVVLGLMVDQWTGTDQEVDMTWKARVHEM
ncbi:hypothetical protein B0H63DRAFT_559071 [Podospora didyma]|uniref:Uncharacterized protein n=1 Tax=Podospora didyma TaxID=330526 RepID=A0AAE0NTS2_9PEZI|nr:hypothetical protein B0H63DRAFT_559071 [Podospora didyma]